MSAGKGSSPRPFNGQKFRDNHDRIFSKLGTINLHGPCLSTSLALDRVMKGEIFDGHEYLGDGSWHTVDHHEQELRDDEE